MLYKLFKSLIWLFLFTIVFGVTGCGQSGPLFLPKEVIENDK